MSIEQQQNEEKYNSVAIEKELQRSYLEYAMSVIVGRALPDVRDGLKPVHRRALFAMRELGVVYNRPYVKSARIVGDIIGKYHPHGDIAAYDTIVRMAQNFSMRYPLVDGQGNFGSLDGDSPAAMRYTEARMTRIDREIVVDLDKDTVDFIPNYDNSLSEPTVMPTRFPNLLVNGSSGIAVGMATNIPPHNLNEVINGILALVDNPDMEIRELMTLVSGPDFPTGGLICGHAGIREAYETGKGIINLRGRVDVEKHQDGGREAIIISEIPYQQNKAQLVERIAALVKEKRIESISEVRDESDRHGLRVVVELKRDENPEVVINQLYTMTPLQKSFGIIFLAIVDNRPEILNLKQLLEHFLNHRKTVVYRRTAFELQKAEEREHILLGLSIAVQNIDEVVAIIRASENPVEAKAALIERFSFSEIQAQTILDMRLQRLTGLEIQKILNEHQQVLTEIKRLKEILGDENLILGIIREECEAIKSEYGDERRTEIIDAVDEILPEDLIPNEDMVITVTHTGYIKRNSASLYRAQHRGGKGVNGMKSADEDFVSNLYIARSHDTFLFFTNTGRVYWRKVYELPESGRISRGRAIVNFLQLADDEKIAAILPITSFENTENNRSILMVTKKGIVKKTSIDEFARPLKVGKRALTFKEGDEIVTAALLNGDNTILLVSRKGMSIHFPEGDIRVMGRQAAGVIGMRLADDDEVVGAVVVTSEDPVLIVTENGFGKKSSILDYSDQSRGGKGKFAIKTSERNGDIIGVKQVGEDQEIILISDSGKMIRINVSSIRETGRTTQGVRLINLADSEKVVDFDTVAKESADESDEIADDAQEENPNTQEGDGV
ncbi:MAG: DNA gyrase subunit A [Desulfobulbaceae bacterium]|jgi:DNA gyrase subunit A|nr:DNA gyrase subunit A [Desulfobulbaceae bacterium]